MDAYVEVWEGTECKSFCPNGYEMLHPPGTWMCTVPPEAPLTPYCCIFTESPSHRHDQLLAPCPAPLPSGEWKFQVSNQGVIFLWPAPTQEPRRVATLGQKMPLELLSLREITKVLGTLTQELGAETNMYFLLSQSELHWFSDVTLPLHSLVRFFPFRNSLTCTRE